MIMKLLNLIILLFVPFVMMGLIKKTKSFWRRRKGPSIWQPLYDFVRLVKKDFVISKTTSVVFRIAPVFALATVLFAALLALWLLLIKWYFLQEVLLIASMAELG